MNEQKEKTQASHILWSVGTIVSALAVIILAALRMTEALPSADAWYLPALGLMEACQAGQHWHTRRTIAYVSLGVSIFIFVCSALVLFVL